MANQQLGFFTAFASIVYGMYKGHKDSKTGFNWILAKYEYDQAEQKAKRAERELALSTAVGDRQVAKMAYDQALAELRASSSVLEQLRSEQAKWLWPVVGVGVFAVGAIMSVSALKKRKRKKNGKSV